MLLLAEYKGRTGDSQGKMASEEDYEFSEQLKSEVTRSEHLTVEYMYHT